MKSKIITRKDFQNKIYNNSINLLIAIKEHSLTRYEMLIISDTMRAFLNTRQKNNKSLQDFTRRFKTSKEIFLHRSKD